VVLRRLEIRRGYPGRILKVWRGLRRSMTRESDILAARCEADLLPVAHRDGTLALRNWLSAAGKAAINEILEEEPGLGDEQEIFEELLEASKPGGKLASIPSKRLATKAEAPNQINLMTLAQFERAGVSGRHHDRHGGGSHPSSYAERRRTSRSRPAVLRRADARDEFRPPYVCVQGIAPDNTGEKSDVISI